MPIQLQIFHPDRIAVGVGRGDVSLQEYQDFLVQVMEAKVMHYRKLIDITLASSTTMQPEHLLALEARLSAFAGKMPRGPLAIVVDAPHQENAKMFKALASKDRPVEVFGNIHAARKWLLEQPIVTPPKSA
jgi:hypothetical protein